MNTNIYKVMVTSLDIGMRIERFTVTCYMFTDYQKALGYAYELAQTHEKCNMNKPLVFNDKGVYSWPDSSYKFWDEFSIRIETDSLNFDEDIINQTTFEE